MKVPENVLSVATFAVVDLEVREAVPSMVPALAARVVSRVPLWNPLPVMVSVVPAKTVGAAVLGEPEVGDTVIEGAMTVNEVVAVSVGLEKEALNV